MTSMSSPAEGKHIPIAQGRSEHDLPSPYSMTPGGTIYSTTPGGTRVKYDRNMLMHLRGSPYAQTPPVHALPVIPGVTAPKDPNTPDNDDDDGAGASSDDEVNQKANHEPTKKSSPKDDDDVFPMEP
eukprot:c23031_g1_i1.p1 GENE.c23031_g1_i1~~c23031_g1_i1.p1  ORF type:complete len:127 (-),score=25.46 c23031_g1_i1:226-606(-)